MRSRKNDSFLPDLGKRKYIEEVDLIRGLAILGVLFVHVTSVPTVTLGGHSGAYPIYIFLNKFGKLGTPTFIFLSSVVLFYTYIYKVLNTDRAIHFYRQRLLFILVPYLVWSTAYYLMLLTNGYENWHHLQQFDWERFLWRDLLYGKAYSHLYFVIISIQLYILFPFLLLFLQRNNRLRKGFLVLGIVGLWSFFFYILFTADPLLQAALSVKAVLFAILAALTGLLLLLQRHNKWTEALFLLGFIGQWGFFFYNHFIWHFQFKGSLFFSYLTYYTLGAFVGIYFERVTEWLNAVKIRNCDVTSAFKVFVFIVWLGTGFYHVYLYYNAYVYNEWVNTRWYELAWNLYTLTSVVMLYYVAVWFKVKAPGLLRSTLAKLGLASFGIYLVHPMILYFWRQQDVSSPEPIAYHLFIVGGWAVALIGSWMIVVLTQRFIPGAWMIFGQGRKRKKGKQKEV